MNVFWNTDKIFYTSSLYFLRILLAIDFSLVFTVHETIQMSGLWRVGSHSCLFFELIETTSHKNAIETEPYGFTALTADPKHNR